VLGVCEGIKPGPVEDVFVGPEKISACIITKNAEKTIERCLKSLRGAVDEIVIVDSGSADNTLSICRRYTDQIYRTDFEGNFSSLRNRASRYARNPWILALDADEYLSDELRTNLPRLTSNRRYKGYFFRRVNYYGDEIISYGFLRFDLLLRLYQKEGAFFYGKVHEKVITAGANLKTSHALFHRPAENNFTFTSFRIKWRKYIAIEAEEKGRRLTKPKRLLYRLYAPADFLIIFFRDLFLLLGILDGLKGIKIAYFRALYGYELNLAIFKRLS
jgi:(heptosyl)LPS beta-1,4-glucosyltransferase